MKNKIDYSKIITLKTFEDNFLPIINSLEYEKIKEKSQLLISKIKENEHMYVDTIKDSHGHETRKRFTSSLGAGATINFINYELRNEKNTIDKYLIIINTFFDDNVFNIVLNKFNVDVDDFVKKLNNLIQISKILKDKSLDNIDNNITNILTTLNSYYAITNYNLFVLKIYQIYYSKKLNFNKKR